MAGNDRMLVRGSAPSSSNGGGKIATSRRSATTLVFSALLIVSITASLLSLRVVDHVRMAATLEDILYISSPKLLKQLSLGYDGLLADIYWTRVVQYYGGMHRAGGGRYELLWPLLDVTSQLDPRLVAT